MLDIDDHLRRVWNPDVRPIIAEAWRCFGIGAYRATITLTWLAVCEDLAEKIVRLAEDGDGVAVDAKRTIEVARSEGLTSIGIRAMQDLERSLLTTAGDLELVDTITSRELERLREDRHLCVHPSLRGEVYEPRAESAREHLAAALGGLLAVPATQGRKVVDRFILHVADSSFTPTADYLIQTFFDQVRPGTRKGIVELAAKHALLELPATDPPGARIVADRMAVCLVAFAHTDRQLARDTLSKLLDRFRHVEGEALFRALGRLGGMDLFWEVVDAALTQRLAHVVSELPPPDRYGNLEPGHVEVLSLVAGATAREALPTLEVKFAALHHRAKAAVIAQRPSEYFGDHIASLLVDATGWRSAEEIARNAVVPMGALLTQSQLAEILDAWASNDQCRTAGGMLAIAADFYASTRHLHPADRALWQQFIRKVRQLEENGSPYTYEALERALDA
jgi:hypothetical protein